MKAFLDTNVVIYAFTDDPRSSIAEELLGDGVELSIQVLNEFTNVARRKLGFDWSQVEKALSAITTLARKIHPIDMETHATARALARRHGFAFYDALIVASAQRARCEILYSEDMQDGLVIEGGLRIANPFIE
jgi:predicted nucleic acid-binding protein